MTPSLVVRWRCLSNILHSVIAHSSVIFWENPNRNRNPNVPPDGPLPLDFGGTSSEVTAQPLI